MINVKRPQKGQRTLQSIFDSVNSIIDYLPTLTVRGDNYSTYVEHSTAGTIVHAKQSVSPDQTGQGGKYYAGSGIAITSGNFINAQLSAGPNIHIDYNNGYFVISGTPAGSGTTPPPGGIEYIGDGDLGSGHIFVDNAATPNPIISSNLYWISDLNNLPFVESSNIVMPNSLTACNNTVDISQVGQIYSNHFLQTRDILYDGVGTKVNLAWMRNPFGDTSPDGTNGIVQGLQVDLTLSGGRYTDVILHKHVFGAYDPDSGTRYDPPTESRVDCLLTGTYDHYPHTSGFIDIVPVEMEDGKTWGVISTNLHAGSGIAIDAKTGEITCTIEGGGGGGGGIEYYDGRFISISSDNTINCTLSSLSELYNQPIISDSRPLSTEIESTYVYPDHFMQFKDWIGNKGQNTIITSGSFINTHQGAGEPGSWQYIFKYTGPQVDCLLTGGRFIEVNSHWQDSGGETPEEIEPDDHTINSLLSGDNQHIFIKELTGENEINSNGSWGGIISTNIHGDETTIHMAADGTLSAIGGGGGGGGGCPWPNYNNLGEESNTLVYPLMRYSTSTGGWLRVSCRGGTSRCVGVWIDDNYYGLGQGVMTWPLAIPPGCTFYVDVDWNLNNRVWFDSSVSPSTITLQQYLYWFTPPEYIAQSVRNNISEVRNTMNNARYEQNQCYSYMTQAKSTLNSMINDWTVHEQYEPDEDYPSGKEPESLSWYQDSLNYIRKQLSGNYEGDGECCEYHLGLAIEYSELGSVMNTNLPSSCPVYSYQFSDVVTRSQQYYDDIEQYITSGQYYYNLAEQYWQSQE